MTIEILISLIGFLFYFTVGLFILFIIAAVATAIVVLILDSAYYIGFSDVEEDTDYNEYYNTENWICDDD